MLFEAAKPRIPITPRHYFRLYGEATLHIGASAIKSRRGVICLIRQHFFDIIRVSTKREVMPHADGRGGSPIALSTAAAHAKYQYSRSINRQ